MKLTPVRDRIVVRPLENETQTRSGIVIPDTAQEKPVQGVVIAVGSGRLAENGSITPLEVKVGDRVMFGKYSGQVVKVEDQEHLVLKEDELIAIVE